LTEQSSRTAVTVGAPPPQCMEWLLRCHAPRLVRRGVEQWPLTSEMEEAAYRRDEAHELEENRASGKVLSAGFFVTPLSPDRPAAERLLYTESGHPFPKGARASTSRPRPRTGGCQHPMGQPPPAVRGRRQQCAGAGRDVAGEPRRRGSTRRRRPPAIARETASGRVR